jgi:hypothetical protein
MPTSGQTPLRDRHAVPSSRASLFCACAALALLAAATGCARQHPPGVLAAADPVQVAEAAPPFVFESCRVTPLARFHVTARVLHTRDYRGGRESRLSPRDLALGWGPMSDSAVLADLRIDQMYRYFTWSARELPLEREDIVSHSANMHIIPADPAVRRALMRTAAGDVVTIDGELVQVSADDGWSWTSSLTRDDTGGGACELVFARSLEVK